MNKVSTNWKLLSKKPLVQNKYYELWDDEVETPDGRIMHWYVRRNSDFSVTIPLVDECVYLVEQYRYPVGSLSWEFPMGKVQGKTPLEMAEVELQEETGIKAKKLIQIGKYWTGAGGSNAETTVYIAKGLSFGKANPDEFEEFTMKKFSVSEVGQMITVGQILDAHTIVAYHYLESYLSK